MSEPIKKALSDAHWNHDYGPDGADGPWSCEMSGREESDYLAAWVTRGEMQLASSGSVLVATLDAEQRHGLAALCLDGQPFGFRWEDVERCRVRARDYEAMYDNGRVDSLDDSRYWNGLADRIEALLRPRKEGE